MERYILLNAIDRLWQEHLYAMDALREGVYLRAYGQKDPLVEFKSEAFEMFTALMGTIKNEVLHNLFRSTSNLMAFEQFLSSLPQLLTAPDETGEATHTQLAGGAELRSDSAGLDDVFARVSAEAPKVGRNDPCPCGSGRKFKGCCGGAAVV
jgi:preprotein translocase subunit SecA